MAVHDTLTRYMYTHRFIIQLKQIVKVFFDVADDDLMMNIALKRALGIMQIYHESGNKP